MNSGSLQTFRPTVAHGACNSGNRARLHLMIDVYEDDRLKSLLTEATPLPRAPCRNCHRRLWRTRSGVCA